MMFEEHTIRSPDDPSFPVAVDYFMAIEPQGSVDVCRTHLVGLLRNGFMISIKEATGYARCEIVPIEQVNDEG